MSTSIPKRRFLRVAIGLLVALLIFVGGDLLLVRSFRGIHVSYDTTRITGPKLPDGSIDYLRAMEDHFSSGVTPENNAAIPILQALGRAALPPTQPRDGITNRMGMPPLPDKGDYYITHDDYFRSRQVEDELDPTDSTKPSVWPVTIDSVTAEWIHANEKPLALLAEASTRSRYFIPFNGGNRPSTLVSVLLPHLNPLHNTRRALLTRALLRLQHGDSEGFANDIRTGHRLARLLGQDSTLIGRLVAVNYERSTCHVQRLGIASGELSPQQMQQMLDELTRLGELPPIVDCVDYGERFIGLDALQALAKSSDEGRAELFNGLFNSNNSQLVFQFWPIDYDKCMRSLNRGYDTLIEGLNKPTFPEREQAFDFLDLQLELKRRDGPVRLMLGSDWPQVMLLPGLNKATEQVESANMDAKLTEVALALQLFKAGRGSYPTALSELMPAHLKQVPIDSFSSQPMIYSGGAKGYTLRSVGPNMTDDSGKGDDLVVSMP